MSVNLTVILGARASRGSVEHQRTSEHPVVPPVTKEIFATRFDHISKRYEDVKSVTVGISAELESGRSIEDFLKEHLGTYSNYEPLPSFQKRQLNQFPLYLQDLFSYISQELKISTLYSRFVNYLFRKDIKITFLTLNYDLLLDYAIEQVEGIKFVDFGGYIRSPDKWILIKLHGSVNWFRQIRNYSQAGNTRESWKSIVKNMNVLKDLDDDLKLLDLDNKFKEGFAGNIPYYPALAIPNTDYQPIYPSDSHKKLLEERLKECENFLIIGFSAYDQDMLKLLNDNVKNVRKLLIVGSDDVGDVYERLKNSVPKFSSKKPETVQYRLGFGRFLKAGTDCNNFLNEIIEKGGE